jgi:glycosyltransferase involved in cell wall biosynthesis
VTVVIPTHNRPQWLRRAVDSVLAQAFRELEIIVVDDGSNPAVRFAGIEDARLQVVRHERSRGAAAARNTGIAAARGEFIAFLDDDDYWLPAKLQRQLVAIGGAAAILCAATRESDGRLDRVFSGNEIRIDDVRRGFVFGAGTSTVLVRADVMRRLLFDETLPCNQDWDLMMRLVEVGRVRYLRDPLVVFNDGDHIRITRTPDAHEEPERSPRNRALYKHRDALGPFWFNYQLARRMLRDVRGRGHPLQQLGRTLLRCGVMPVAAVYGQRMAAHMGRRASSRCIPGE